MCVYVCGLCTCGSVSMDMSVSVCGACELRQCVYKCVDTSLCV